MTTPEDPGQPGQPIQPGEPSPPYGGQPPASGYPPPPAAPEQQPYGAPPQGYGTPQPYGTPQGYGAPGYPAPYGAPQPGYGGPPGQLADWGARVVGGLIDYFIPGIVAALFYRISVALGVILWLASLAWIIYNKVIEGQTGQSIGKRVAGTRLLREQDGQVVGAGLAIGRWLLHIVDGIPCYLGYLWPLWDAKKQTFADKIVKTLVVKA